MHACMCVCVRMRDSRSEINGGGVRAVILSARLPVGQMTCTKDSHNDFHWWYLFNLVQLKGMPHLTVAKGTGTNT